MAFEERTPGLRNPDKGKKEREYEIQFETHGHDHGPSGGGPFGKLREENSGTGNTGTSNSCNHPIVSYTTPFTYSLSGNGSTGKSTPSGVIHADQDLRVQVVPGSAIVNSTGSGTKQYTKMGVTVTLLKNGSEVPGASVTIPGGTSATGYRNGLAVGAKSQIVDFSTYLSSGNNTYSVKVSNIMSDYTCKTYCTENNPQYWLWNGYYYYPDWQMINACKALQCDVGSVDNVAGWSMTVQVETDNTPCLTQ
ncbi:MAG: hypothetical protein HYW49_05395 [Deltaproteobacteria bacterium]|nr:hypothetical protein [Deltaproteobacteria bacterium]